MRTLLPPPFSFHLLFVVLFGHAAVADDSLPTASAAAFVQKYCSSCHEGNDAPAGVVLNASLTDSLWKGDGEDISTADFELWEKVIRRLRARQMPPADADRPEESEYLQVLSILNHRLSKAISEAPNPGHVDAIRRLNATEYQNVIRDLLRVKIDAHEMLPADQSGHGFDNVTLQDLPPVLLNRYVAAARRIARLALGGTERSPGGRTIRLPADRSQNAHVDGLPLGTRGGLRLEHQFPQTGEYEIQVRLMRDRDERIEGLRKLTQLDILLDRRRVRRFKIKPPKNAGSWGGADFTLLDSHLKHRMRVDAGLHQLGVTFPVTSQSVSEIYREPYVASFNLHRHPRLEPAVYEVSIIGPFDPQGAGDTPSRQTIFGEETQRDADGASRILTRLLTLAYRRKISAADLEVPLKFFHKRFQSDGFDAGMESALTAILVNPHFLLRSEGQPATAKAGDVYSISDTELASRLSFFLWSSMPDRTLLDLAISQQLRDPEVLTAQVRRMLRDPKSDSLVHNFAGQWLHLRNLESFVPDRRLFTDFDDNLREAMRQETELAMRDVITKDSSVLALIRSDRTYLNERLARHYDISGVVGSQFRPVKLTNQSHRGGILRHASVLAVTSYATRTSPTIRGNWILENLLGTAPPPPPPNVPALQERTALDALTVRERLAEHRANPACASCHNLMDPIGFSLENYDTVGRWRVHEKGLPIDSAGSMPDGTEVNSVQMLEQAIMDRPELFVGTLTEKLLVFALGRGPEPTDGPIVRDIVRTAGAADYSFSSVVTGIVQSPLFQMRVAQ